MNENDLTVVSNFQWGFYSKRKRRYYNTRPVLWPKKKKKQNKKKRYYRQQLLKLIFLPKLQKEKFCVSGGWKTNSHRGINPDSINYRMLCCPELLGLQGQLIWIKLKWHIISISNEIIFPGRLQSNVNFEHFIFLSLSYLWHCSALPVFPEAAWKTGLEVISPPLHQPTCTTNLWAPLRTMMAAIVCYESGASRGLVLTLTKPGNNQGAETTWWKSYNQ